MIGFDAFLNYGNSDFKVSFPHPQFHEDMEIFIHSNMRHIIEKYVNALERSGVEKNNTNLMFNKEKISLNWLYRI